MMFLLASCLSFSSGGELVPLSCCFPSHVVLVGTFTPPPFTHVSHTRSLSHVLFSFLHFSLVVGMFTHATLLHGSSSHRHLPHPIITYFSPLSPNSSVSTTVYLSIRSPCSLPSLPYLCVSTLVLTSVSSYSLPLHNFSPSLLPTFHFSLLSPTRPSPLPFIFLYPPLVPFIVSMHRLQSLCQYKLTIRYPL